MLADDLHEILSPIQKYKKNLKTLFGANYR